MSVYSVNGTLTGTGYVTVKAGALPIKVIRIDSSATASVHKFIGGGSITGGTTVTPQPAREGAPVALATGKNTATAVSGTDIIVASIGAGGNYSFPVSEVIAAGSSSVIAVFSTVTGAGLSIWIDELEVQPGY